jgi:Encapsulating protein for peroxidase
MNNHHRELAPISEAAWAQIEEETTRTIKRYLAGRRVADVHGPAGAALSAIGTGHQSMIEAPEDGVAAEQREVKSLVELRVPFELDREMLATSNAVQTTLTGNPQRRPLASWPSLKIAPFSKGTAPPESSASAREQVILKNLFPVMSELSRGFCEGLETAASGRCEWTLLDTAERECLHRTRRNQRLRLSSSRTRQTICQRQDHLGARD